MGGGGRKGERKGNPLHKKEEEMKTMNGKNKRNKEKQNNKTHRKGDEQHKETNSSTSQKITVARFRDLF